MNGKNRGLIIRICGLTALAMAAFGLMVGFGRTFTQVDGYYDWIGASTAGFNFVSLQDGEVVVYYEYSKPLEMGTYTTTNRRWLWTLPDGAAVELYPYGCGVRYRYRGSDGRMTSKWMWRKLDSSKCRRIVAQSSRPNKSSR